jgi:hypothetical protein
VPATIAFRHGTGAASAGLATTNTAFTNARLCTSDTANAGTLNPLIVPTAGTNYSYEQWHYLNADTTPTGTVNNVKWYTDGSVGWTGVTLYVGVSSTYVQATGTPGSTGTLSTVATTNAGTYTQASPLTVSGSISNPNTGKITQFVVVQGRITSSATSSTTLATETISWRYDET